LAEEKKQAISVAEYRSLDSRTPGKNYKGSRNLLVKGREILAQVLYGWGSIQRDGSRSSGSSSRSNSSNAVTQGVAAGKVRDRRNWPIRGDL
jgi:hypothetical protein